jgi:TRAP-type mannitol/chloroaromatic compound transport system permease small subunit
VFLLCSPWTLLDNEHIRIDIINNQLPKRVRDIIDVIGHAFFLLPLCVVMIITSYPFFTRSLLLNEQSMNAGGLPQWPGKLMAVLAQCQRAPQGPGPPTFSVPAMATGSRGPRMHSNRMTPAGRINGNSAPPAIMPPIWHQ